MIKYLIMAFIALINFNACGQQLEGSIEILKPIKSFLSMPEYEAFCSAEDWTRDSTDYSPQGIVTILEPKFKQIFSGEFFKMYMWIKCVRPVAIRPLSNDRSYYFDFRYGSPAQSGDEFPKVYFEQPHKLPGGRVSIKVNWEKVPPQMLWARYTLLLENGQWKIDDIALSGYEIDMGTEGKEWVLPRSKSLKTELQSAYKRAEAKCLQTPACKAKLGK